MHPWIAKAIAFLDLKFPGAAWNTWYVFGFVNWYFELYPLGTGVYSLRKISASNGHQIQFAFYAHFTRADIPGQSIPVVSGQIHICTEFGDTPNWGSGYVYTNITSSCANQANNWILSTAPPPPPPPEPAPIQPTTRNQSSRIKAAIKGDRTKTCGLLALVHRTVELEVGLYAAVDRSFQLDLELNAALEGVRNMPCGIRSAIMGLPQIPIGLSAAVATDFETTCELRANCEFHGITFLAMRAAIQGESEITCGLRALVVLSRADQIYSDMENLLPQENDLRSIPNWASHVKDYRKDPIG